MVRDVSQKPSNPADQTLFVRIRARIVASSKGPPVTSLPAKKGSILCRKAEAAGE